MFGKSISTSAEFHNSDADFKQPSSDSKCVPQVNVKLSAKPFTLDVINIEVTSAKTKCSSSGSVGCLDDYQNGISDVEEFIEPISPQKETLKKH